MRIQGWGFIDLNSDKILLKKTQGNCFSNKQLKCFKISWKTSRNSQFFPPQFPVPIYTEHFLKYISPHKPPPPLLRQYFTKLCRSKGMSVSWIFLTKTDLYNWRGSAVANPDPNIFSLNYKQFPSCSCISDIMD